MSHRSFSTADVNTAVTLVRASDPSETDRYSPAAFLSILDSAHFPTPEGMAMALSGQSADQSQKPDRTFLLRHMRGIGVDKWAARFLRPGPAAFALQNYPDMVPLGELAELTYGNKPGIASFFVLDRGEAARRGLEQRFLIPIISTTREILGYEVAESTTQRLAFCCELAETELERKKLTSALEYVRWGKRQTTKPGAKHTVAGRPWPEVRSVSGNRPEWHCWRLKRPGDFIIPCLLDKRFIVAFNRQGLAETNMFFHGRFRDIDPAFGCALLNSTPVYLMLELFGRPKGMGGLNLYGYDLGLVPVPAPGLFAESQRTALTTAFARLCGREIRSIFDECGQGDPGRVPEERRQLDEVVFDALGLDDAERSAFYMELVALVRRRLFKGRRNPGAPARK